MCSCYVVRLVILRLTVYLLLMAGSLLLATEWFDSYLVRAFLLHAIHCSQNVVFSAKGVMELL